VGLTVKEVGFGLTKKPRQPAASVRVSRTVRDKNSENFLFGVVISG
jgi:hypothetical protein